MIFFKFRIRTKCAPFYVDILRAKFLTFRTIYVECACVCVYKYPSKYPGVQLFWLALFSLVHIAVMNDFERVSLKSNYFIIFVLFVIFCVRVILARWKERQLPNSFIDGKSDVIKIRHMKEWIKLGSFFSFFLLFKWDL